jgi:hypothetical protein
MSGAALDGQRPARTGAGAEAATVKELVLRVLTALVLVAFLAWAALPIAAELVGAYR